MEATGWRRGVRKILLITLWEELRDAKVVRGKAICTSNTAYVYIRDSISGIDQNGGTYLGRYCGLISGPPSERSETTRHHIAPRMRLLTLQEVARQLMPFSSAVVDGIRSCLHA